MTDLNDQYTPHPAAMAWICEEIERVVWPLDRQYFKDHPDRTYRIRPAIGAEITEVEITSGEAIEHEPCMQAGMHPYMIVRQLTPGILRARCIFFVAQPSPDWDDPPEEFCRYVVSQMGDNPLMSETTGQQSRKAKKRANA